MNGVNVEGGAAGEWKNEWGPVFIIFQTQIYMDLHILDVAHITHFIYFNSHGYTPSAQ